MFQIQAHWHLWNFWQNTGQVSSKAGENTSFMWNLCETQWLWLGFTLSFTFKQSKVLEFRGKERDTRKQQQQHRKQWLAREWNGCLPPSKPISSWCTWTCVAWNSTFALSDDAAPGLPNTKGETTLDPQRQGRTCSKKLEGLNFWLLKMQIWRWGVAMKCADFGNKNWTDHL